MLTQGQCALSADSEVEFGAPAEAAVAPVRRTPAWRGRAALVKRQFATGDHCQISPLADHAALVVVHSGMAKVTNAEGVSTVTAGDVLLVAQDEGLALEWQGRGATLVIAVPRATLQATAFARRDQPRRLGRANLKVRGKQIGQRFEQAVAGLCANNVVRLANRDKGGDCLVQVLVEELADWLCDAREGDAVFPVAGSVRRALDRLEQADVAPATIADLARAAGVVPDTLRRSVKATTGLMLNRLIDDARLDWARARLCCNRESRSLSDLASALGYAPVAFTRAYRRRFGETPTQTRSQAFASAG